MESSVMLEIDMDLRLMAGIRRRNCDGAFKRQGAGAQEASGGACTAVVTTLIRGAPHLQFASGAAGERGSVHWRG